MNYTTDIIEFSSETIDFLYNALFPNSSQKEESLVKEDVQGSFSTAVTDYEKG